MPSASLTSSSLLGVLTEVQRDGSLSREASVSDERNQRPPSRPLINDNAIYPLDQCLIDAQASGLEPDSLREQVLELCQRMMTGGEPDGAFQARQAASQSRSILDHARMLAGIMLDPALDSPTISGSLTMPSLGAVREPPSPTPEDAPAPIGGGWAVARSHRSTIAAAAEKLEKQTPMQTSSIRRAAQHLSAAVSPLIAPLSQAGAAVAMGGVGGLAATAGVASMAAVGGLTQSMTTHEHHAQQQETSRKLQRVALEQDRHLHVEAQSLAEKLTAEAMAHETRLHRQGLWREQQQHSASLLQERKLHEAALRVDHRLHFEGILADLREQDREADRDLWEQRTERFQMLMTVSSLFTTGGFALAVEGQLPAEPGCWDLMGSAERSCTAGGGTAMVEVAALHYVLLACGFGLQLCVVMGCLALTSRFAEFMDMRVQKQQLLNKDLRRVAVKMLGSEEERRSSGVDDDETVTKFEKVLRQQYVIETCDAGHPGRHIWNFNDWYLQRCALLAVIVEGSFRLGMLGLLGSILTFVFAHLQRGDPLASVQSASAWRGFAYTLGILIFVAVVMPQVVGSSWMWRLRRDKLRGKGRCFGLFKAHRPVRFDMHQLSAQAEDLFNAIDTDQNGTLSELELRQAAQRARKKAELARQADMHSPKTRPSAAEPIELTDLAAAADADAAGAADALGARPLAPRPISVLPSAALAPDGAASAPRRPGSGISILSAPGAPSAAMPPAALEINVDVAQLGSTHSSSASSQQRMLPSSPRGEDEQRRRAREEQAAATAVLETIIRRMALTTERRAREQSRKARPKLKPKPKRGRGYLRKAAADKAADKEAAAPAPEPGSSRHSGTGNGNGRRLSQSFKNLARMEPRAWEVKKEDWDEAIAEALF